MTRTSKKLCAFKEAQIGPKIPTLTCNIYKPMPITQALIISEFGLADSVSNCPAGVQDSSGIKIKITIIIIIIIVRIMRLIFRPAR